MHYLIYVSQINYILLLLSLCIQSILFDLSRSNVFLQQVILHTQFLDNYLCNPCVCMCVLSCTVVSNSLQPHEWQPTRLFCPLNFPNKNAGAGCHFLLLGIFLTQGLNLCLTSPALAGGFFTSAPSEKLLFFLLLSI